MRNGPGNLAKLHRKVRRAMSDSSFLKDAYMETDSFAQAAHYSVFRQPTTRQRLPGGQAAGSEDDEAFLLAHPWVRHYEHGVPAHVTLPDHPLTWLLDQASCHYRNHTAFIYYGTRLTYAQFANSANRFADALQQLGVKKGTRIALMLPNIPQYHCLLRGTQGWRHRGSYQPPV